MNSKLHFYLFLLIALITSTSSSYSNKAENNTESPRIINIVNFIRQTDYRLENADERMFKTVQEQIKLVNKYDFPATFLFQYDALINTDYQNLMKTQLSSKCEIGAWWEITQPHVEAAGLVWRGIHPWVSTANIAFTTGYTPTEREKLVDVYMEKFKAIYGQYPRSVGSWFIDSHSLAYMYEKYNIVASCNCKDQVGTDGYTLWGGYWNQAYYPSRKNAYMPAQTAEGQIPVPIFRMLGSDPIHQYETGVGTSHQGVISLEPVYNESGKNRKWVEYFLKSITDEPSLSFNYAQAGQENSFTWEAMQEGLEMQFPIFDSLKNVGKIKIETLEQTGKWFKQNFPLTPATAVTTLVDYKDQGNKSIWYNSRFYRSSVIWNENGFSFRDIHLFDEEFESAYYKTPGKGDQFLYFTLPVIDRYFWSTPDDKIGLKFVKTDQKGVSSPLILIDTMVSEQSDDELKIALGDNQESKFTISFHEDKINITCNSNQNDLNWSLVLHVPKERLDRLPFKTINDNRIFAEFKNHNYVISLQKGKFIQNEDDDTYIFSIVPVKNHIVIDLSGK